MSGLQEIVRGYHRPYDPSDYKAPEGEAVSASLLKVAMWALENDIRFRGWEDLSDLNWERMMRNKLPFKRCFKKRK